MVDKDDVINKDHVIHKRQEIHKDQEVHMDYVVRMDQVVHRVWRHVETCCILIGENPGGAPLPDIHDGPKLIGIPHGPTISGELNITRG